MNSDLRIILWFLRPKWIQVSLIFLFLLIYSLIETATIGSFYPLINSILSGSDFTGSAGKVLGFINSLSHRFMSGEYVISSCLFLLSMMLTSNVIGFLAESFTVWQRYRLHADYLNMVYKKLLTNRYRFFIEKKQGDLLYIGIDASQSVGEMLLYFPKVGVELFRIITITILLSSMSVKVTMSVFIVIIFFGFIIHTISVRVVYPIAKSQQDLIRNITSIFSESIAGIRQIKIFNSPGPIFERFRENVELCRSLMVKNGIANLIVPKLIQVFGVGSIVGSVIYLKMFMPDNFREYLPLITVYIISIQRLMPSMSNIGNFWMGLKGLAPRLKITYDTLNDREFLIEDSGRDFEGLSKDILLKDISFSFQPGREVLKGINISIPAKRTVAIVGESGSGKSTLADIIVRLHEPKSGSVYLDGVDYMEFSEGIYLAKVGMVTQDTFIFHASAAENIKIGRPDATDGQVIAAAKIANAHDFIMELENGYDTLLGDRGIKLSGGQRQRIAIARAIVREPEILILDEATSALDNLSEKIVKEALRAAGVNRTNIVIAHRLSTIEYCDMIYVLSRGEIIEEGTHDDLIKRQGYYYRLYSKERDLDSAI